LFKTYLVKFISIRCSDCKETETRSFKSWTFETNLQNINILDVHILNETEMKPCLFFHIMKYLKSAMVMNVISQFYYYIHHYNMYLYLL